MPTERLSTDDIHTTGFRPHGRVVVWSETGLVYYEATGPFNREVVDRLAIAQRDFLKEHTPAVPWGSIGIMRVSALMSEDALARYQELMSSPKPAPMVPVATAFVMGEDVEGRRLMAPLYARVYGAIARPFAVFDTLPAAQAWVRERVGGPT